MDDVILTVDGARHYGWEQVRIIQSLDYVAHSFELTLTEKWANRSGGTIRRSITAGMPATLHIDNTLLISGYIDEVVPSYDAATHVLRVHGRSKAGDLVDCSLPGRTFNNQSLLQIGRALAQPFGLSVNVHPTLLPPADTTATEKPFRQVRLEPGQPIYEFLEELARIRAVRFISDAEGNLLLTRAGQGVSFSDLVLGQNILSAQGSLSLRDRYTTYTALAQQDYAQGTAETNALISQSATDNWGRFNRYRPKVFMVEGAADAAAAQQRADWQRRTAYGRSQGVTYTVAGWRQANGSLWQYNNTVRIRDAWAGINASRLIVELARVFDAQGRRTELRVMPAEAFELQALPDPETTPDYLQ